MPKTKQRQPARSKARKKRGPQSAQQTIPYREMLKDGICKVKEGYYTKTLAYEDINYSVASSDDQSTIFDGYCSFLNYFDAALPFQLSFINHRSRPENRYSVNIPPQEDDFNSIRAEFTDMLENQIAKSNNGIMRSKYITFGINADGIGTARLGASMPKVMYLVLTRPLFPLESWFSSIPTYSRRMELKSSFWSGMSMDA